MDRASVTTLGELLAAIIPGQPTDRPGMTHHPSPASQPLRLAPGISRTGDVHIVHTPNTRDDE
jgi:hypothetical protein